jgi:predicted protein tyrosine phosphatase
MGNRRTVLFVCSHNLSRSYTAEWLFRQSVHIEVRSAGTRDDARVAVSEDLITWAGEIFVMEEHHAATLRERFQDRLDGKDVVILEIPDIYMPLEPELITLLQDRLAPYLGAPPAQPEDRDHET